MKTKTFFMLCFLLSIGLTQLSAQEDQIGSNTRTYSYKLPAPWLSPVYCEGKQVDYLSIVMECHVVEHKVNGVTEWFNVQYHGEAISELTGEVFKLNESDHVFIPDPSVYSRCHTNLIGNKGTHYIVDGTYNLDGSFTVDKTQCLENGRK